MLSSRNRIIVYIISGLPWRIILQTGLHVNIHFGEQSRSLAIHAGILRPQFQGWNI
jgi:hypothetical protein